MRTTTPMNDDSLRRARRTMAVTKATGYACKDPDADANSTLCDAADVEIDGFR